MSRELEQIVREMRNESESADPHHNVSPRSVLYWADRIAALTASPQAAPGYTASQVAKAWRMSGLFPDATLGKVLENLERLASPQVQGGEAFGYAIEYPRAMPTLDYIRAPDFVKRLDRAEQLRDGCEREYGEPAKVTPLYVTPQRAPGVDEEVRQAVAEWEECASPLAAQAAMFKIANRLRNLAALASGSSGVGGP